jgi:hypothetical protein
MTTFYDPKGIVLETTNVESDFANNNCFLIYVPEKARFFNNAINPIWDDSESYLTIHYFNMELKCFTCCSCKCQKHRYEEAETSDTADSNSDCASTLTTGENDFAYTDAAAATDDDDNEGPSPKRPNLSCNKTLSANL